MLPRILAVVCGLAVVVSCSAGDTTVAQTGRRLDTVCEELRARTCEAMGACCSVAEFSYDAASCRPALWDTCETSAKLVDSGAMAFMEERIEPCIEQLAELYSQCFFTAAEAQWAVELIAPACRQIFDGPLEQGEACDSTKHRYCKQFTDRGVTYCTPQGVCTTLPAKGEVCFASDLYSQCQPPLYCRTELSEPEGQGVCDVLVPLGETCDPDLAISGPCGPGNLCDLSSNTCVAEKQSGSRCDSGYECRSTVCNESECGSVPAIVIDAECSD